MNKKDLDNFSDEEITTLVEKLQSDVRRKKSEVESIHKELKEIQSSISQHQEERQKFTTKLFQAEEATPLIEEGRQLQKQLAEKRLLLSKISTGDAKEQSEVRELESCLDELRSRDELTALEEENKENIQAIQRLESMCEEKRVACQMAKDHLSTLQDKVEKLKQVQQKQVSAPSSTSHRRGRHEQLSRKIDNLILKSSHEAGLKL